jgi:hypothetical protein
MFTTKILRGTKALLGSMPPCPRGFPFGSTFQPLLKTKAAVFIRG